MFNTLKKKKGFSMVEVIVAAVIFALAAAGIFSTISALTKPAAESDNEVTAALIAKQTLDKMRGDVRADTWQDASSNLYIGNNISGGSFTIDGINYSIVYNVRTDDDQDGDGNPDTDGRWVDMQVIW